MMIRSLCPRALLFVLITASAGFSQAGLSAGDFAFTGFSTSSFYATVPGSGTIATYNTGGFGSGTSQSIRWDPLQPDSFYVGGFGFFGRATLTLSGSVTYTLITTSLGMCSQMALLPSGEILFSDYSADQLRIVNPITGVVTDFTTGTQPWGSYLDSVVYDDATGDIYAGGLGEVYRIPSGTNTPVLFSTVTTGGFSGGVTGLAIDPATGYVHGIHWTNNMVYSIDPLGNATELVPAGSVTNPNSLFFDPLTGELHVGAQSGQIHKIVGGVLSTVVTSSPASQVCGLSIVGLPTPTSPMVTAYGVGCGGATLSTTALPSLGGFFPLDVIGATPSSQAYLFLALTQQDPGIPLGSGCSLYLEPNALLQAMSFGVSPFGPLPTSAGGATTFSLTVPSDPGTAGVRIYFQAATADPTHPLGFVTTNALEALIN